MAPARFTLRTPVALAIIALAVVALRIGTWWTEQIDWDEWSFILMGADVARGHLPFVHQFDLKPPLVFFLFGATIALFGKSLLAIRLLGALCVFAAASFVFLTARRLAGAWPALAGSLLTAALASASFGQATSSELPAIAFLSAAVWLLTRCPLKDRDAAMAGALVALAVLTRTNLALVALVLGGTILAAGLLRPVQVSRRAWLAYGAAGLVPPFVVILAYALAGELATLRLAMIDVPLAYSGQLGIAEVARQHAMQFYYTAQGQPLLYGPWLLLTLAGAIAALYRFLRHEDETRSWPLVVLLATTAAVAASLLIGGAAYPHYWLQLMPFAGILEALGVARLCGTKPGLGYAAAALCALPLASGLAISLPRTPASFASPHPAQQAAAHIRATGGRHPSVWALHKHIVLWYLDAPQLSRAGVHPDNLARPAIIDTLAAHGYVGRDEVGRLIALKPQFVVTDAGGKGLAWVRADGKPVDLWLAANYGLDARFEDVLVYRRR
jgi:4-amino-4-deoxy-L-arabinose transferase-like glycosyltransferase